MNKIIELKQKVINTIDGGRMNNPIFNIKKFLVNELIEFIMPNINVIQNELIEFIMPNLNVIQYDPFQDVDVEFLLNTHDDIDYAS